MDTSPLSFIIHHAKPKINLLRKRKSVKSEKISSIFLLRLHKNTTLKLRVVLKNLYIVVAFCRIANILSVAKSGDSCNLFFKKKSRKGFKDSFPIVAFNKKTAVQKHDGLIGARAPYSSIRSLLSINHFAAISGVSLTSTVLGSASITLSP